MLDSLNVCFWFRSFDSIDGGKDDLMVYALHANRIMPQHYIWYECACKVGYASETETKPKHHRKYSCRSIYFGVDDVPCWVATVSVEIESYLTHRYFSYICNCSCSECTACQSSDTKFLARFISFAFFILVFLAYEYLAFVFYLPYWPMCA